MKSVSLIVFIVMVAVFVFFFFWGGNKEETNLQLTTSPSAVAESCELNFGGDWLAEFNECENTGKNWCDEHGGEFFECDSACRHATEPEAPCTMQCVQVCKFKELDL